MKSDRLAPLYEQLQPVRNGHTREEVTQSQRARLFGAMIATVAERGYSAITVNELCARAGVSKRTVYDHFPSKEAYFLATYDLVSYRTIKRIAGAYQAAQDWEEQMRGAFQALASEINEQPTATRLALVEALGAGRGALERVERTSRTFERMLLTGFADSSDEDTPDPLIVKGLVGGIMWALRLNLKLAADDPGIAADEDARWSEIADRLREWVLAYRSPARWQAEPLVYWGTASPVPGALLESPCPSPAHRQDRGLGTDGAPAVGGVPADERMRMLGSALRIAARGGCANMTVAQIVEDAGTSHEVFFTFFDDCQQCVLEAVRQGTRDAYRHVEEACADASDWAGAVHLGARALMEYLAAHPALARVAFVEILMLGPAGVNYSMALIDELSSLLADCMPSAERPGELVARAVAGAVWEIVRHYVTRDGTHDLPNVADRVDYLLLAPVIGPDDAIEVILRAKNREAERELQAIAGGEVMV
jgi:AcrR family transcriptional regulator